MSAIIRGGASAKGFRGKKKSDVGLAKKCIDGGVWPVTLHFFFFHDGMMGLIGIGS